MLVISCSRYQTTDWLANIIGTSIGRVFSDLYLVSNVLEKSGTRPTDIIER